MGIRDELKQALKDELAYARDDIRQKVVEEAWFGRATTPELTQEVEPTTAEMMGFGHLEREGDRAREVERPGIDTRDRSEMKPAREQDNQPPEQEQGVLER
jgi:hypothetical protein